MILNGKTTPNGMTKQLIDSHDGSCLESCLYIFANYMFVVMIATTATYAITGITNGVISAVDVWRHVLSKRAGTLPSWTSEPRYDPTVP